MKRLITYYNNSKIITALSEYCTTAENSNLPLSDSSAIIQALAAPEFDWGTNIPEGPCAGYSALGAIIYLVKHRNTIAVDALRRLALREDIDWLSPQGQKQISGIDCLAYVANSQQAGLDILLLLINHRKIPLTRCITFGKMKECSLFFALMQSLGKNHFISSQYFNQFQQAYDLNWNEVNPANTSLDTDAYPQTPLYYLTLAASQGSQGALSVLPQIVRKQYLDWIQKNDTIFIEYRRIENVYASVYLDQATQQEKNKWRPLACLIEAAIEYPAAYSALVWVLTEEYELEPKFKPHCNQVLSGFSNEQVEMLFFASVNFARRLVVENSVGQKILTEKALKAVTILGQYATYRGFPNAQYHILGIYSPVVETNKSRSAHPGNIVPPVYLPPPPYSSGMMPQFMLPASTPIANPNPYNGYTQPPKSPVNNLYPSKM